jgi:hypothetical protein
MLEVGGVSLAGISLREVNCGVQVEGGKSWGFGVYRVPGSTETDEAQLLLYQLRLQQNLLLLH